MKKVFNIYGQILFIDRTYKIFNKKCTLFLLSIINLEGKTEIITAFNSADETEESLNIFLICLLKIIQMLFLQ